jgi:diguanylate cyclase (GGDEF)-like protein
MSDIVRERDKRGPRRQALGVWLGAVFYVLGGLAVLTTLWALPSEVDRGPAIVAAFVAILAGIGMLFVPWHRFSERALLVLPIGGFALIAAAGAAAPHLLEHYVPLYLLALIFVGLTQAPGTALAVFPLAVASFLLGTSADLPSEQFIGAILIGTFGLFVSESLALVVTRYRAAERDVRQLLAATRRLASAGDEMEASALLCTVATEMLHADVALVYTADSAQASRYTSRATHGLSTGPFAIDIDGEPSGIGEALSTGETVFVSDVARSSLVAHRIIDQLDVASMLYIPLPGQVGHVGALAVGWKKRVRRLHDVAQTTVEVLSTEAGGTLERLGVAARLVQEAATDELTGLMNRRAFNRHLDAMRPGDVVVMIDLDHFKTINDEQGHVAGDAALASMATCLRHAARDSDLVARWGGEEFAVILTRSTLGGAHSMIERARAEWVAAAGPTTFSAGIAQRVEGEGPVMTLGRADSALYRAKQEGRDRVKVADQSSPRRADDVTTT